MNEKALYQSLMWAAAGVATLGGLGTVTLLVLSVISGWTLLLPTVLLAGVTFGAGVAANYFGHRFAGHEKVFSNPIEQEVLDRKQRAHLRTMRGGLVMQRALVEIEHERDNIIHRQIEAANDPDKPPHQTRFGDPEEDQPMHRSIKDRIRNGDDKW